MKFKSVILAGLLSAIVFTSCESKAGTGALAGGAVGAGTGALIAGGKGAAIGGAVGIVGGALIGSALDSQDREKLQNDHSTLRHIDRGEQLTVNDVITMHKAGLSDRKIMDLIDKTNSTYNLNTQSIHRLERAGVSDRVINFMMSR